MITKLNRSEYQAFPYHLVTPSPWPLVLSFSLFSLAISSVLCFHGYVGGELLFNFSFILTITGMTLWFNDIIIEGTFLGDHTKAVRRGIILGIFLFIISEVFAFLSIFWAFLHSSLAPAVELGQAWPPQGVTVLNPFGIPLLNTFILLSSGASITYAHHALLEGNRKGTIRGNVITIVLALIFTALQVVEYKDCSFTISDSVFGSSFFCATGLHGIHVALGTIFISVAFIRIVLYHLTTKHHVGYEFSIYYWHFVDVVWLFLYILVYYWSGI